MSTQDTTKVSTICCHGIICRSLWKQVDDLCPHDPFDEEQRKREHRERAESIKVDQCDGEYENIESETQDADYENTPGEVHDGQYEDTVSEQQDEDYVNTERRNYEDQYDDIDNKYPAKRHTKRQMQGNGIF